MPTATRSLTQRALSHRLGVSPTTVNLVLKDPETPRVSPEVRQRILAHADEVRMPRRRRSGTGAIGYLTRADANPAGLVHAQLLHAAQAAATAAERSLLCRSWTDAGDVRGFLAKEALAGLVVVGPMPRELLVEIAAAVPTVVLNHDLPAAPCPTIMTDNGALIEAAIASLQARGHRRIACLAPAEGPEVRHLRERVAGYCSALVTHGLELDPELLAAPLGAARSRELGAMAVHEILAAWRALAQPPTAVIAYNDELGCSLLNEARNAGLVVPDDLAVIGVDDSPLCTYAAPQLSSLRQPLERMAQAAIDLLVRQRGAGPAPAGWRLRCAGRLIERASSGAAR